MSTEDEYTRSLHRLSSRGAGNTLVDMVKIRLPRHMARKKLAPLEKSHGSTKKENIPRKKPISQSASCHRQTISGSLQKLRIICQTSPGL